MASTSLHHRAISNIRGGAPASPGPSGTGPAPGSPHTPLRATGSTFASPSSLRAEEDTIIVELGSRHLLVGFAGDSVPKGVVRFGPEEKRRVGDFRQWQVGYTDDWKRRARGWREEGGYEGWDEDYELWRGDVRGLDLGLIGDKIERGLREAFTKYLLIDSRPRRMAIVLPPALPTPLLSTTLDTLFTRFESPYVSLHSAPVTSVVGAGLRSGLVVDLGWAETRVTSVYEYREICTTRSVRGGKMFVRRVHALLARYPARKKDAEEDETGAGLTEQEEDQAERIISFEECEDFARRMVWCKASPYAEASQSNNDERKSTPSSPDGLETVTEGDESTDLAASSSSAAAPTQPEIPPETDTTLMTIPLTSTTPPKTLSIPFNQLSLPCEATYFSPHITPTSWDDHELPLPLLIYNHLLKLSADIRGACTPRIIFTGGGAGILGLRARCLDEVKHLLTERGGWSAVTGKALTQLKDNPKLPRRPAPSEKNKAPTSGAELDGVWHDAANAAPEPDPVEVQIRRNRVTTNGAGAADPDPRLPPAGELRVIDSLGAWSGASLLTMLKIPAIATVDRELWAQNGVAGASRVGDVDLKVQQRQSMGPGGGLMRGQGGGNWTLGAWGNV